MELIPKQKIEEASRDYTEQHYGKRQVDTYIHESFDAGIEFALKEVEPLIVEFSEYCGKNNIFLKNSSKWFNHGSEYSTEQLLQQFIEERDKK